MKSNEKQKRERQINVPVFILCIILCCRTDVFCLLCPKGVNGCFLVAVSKAVNGCFLVVVPKRRERMQSIVLLMRRIANYPINAKEKRATEKSRADAQLLRCNESGRQLFGKERWTGARG